MNQKRYPEKYEKSIPIILGIIGLLAVILLSIAFLVLVGIFPS